MRRIFLIIGRTKKASLRIVLRRIRPFPIPKFGSSFNLTKTGTVVGSTTEKNLGIALAPKGWWSPAVISTHNRWPEILIKPSVSWVTWTSNKLAPPAKISRIAS